MNIEKMKQIGSEWQKGDKHRVYFNDLSALYGLKCNYYGSGNISSATLDGSKISNSLAREIQARLKWAKVWFDLGDNEFHGKDINERDLGKIVSDIKTQVA